MIEAIRRSVRRDTLKIQVFIVGLFRQTEMWRFITIKLGKSETSVAWHSGSLYQLKERTAYPVEGVGFPTICILGAKESVHAPERSPSTNLTELQERIAGLMKPTKDAP